MSTKQRNPTMGERIDSAISLFFPKWGFERKQARALLRMSGSYDNLPTWRGSADWMPTDGKAESLNSMDRDLARAKARHLERNSEIVNSILNALSRNVVGNGFNLQVRTDNEDWNAALEELWGEWSRPGNCDVTGRYSFSQLLSMVVRRKFVDGAALVVKNIVANDPQNLPYKLQLLEVDELKGPMTMQSPQGNAIVGGIEVDAQNKPLAYWLRRYNFETMLEEEPKRYEANRVFFLAEHSRPSEVREITPLVRTIGEIRDLDEFFDAVAFKQKISAALAIFITNSDKSYSLPASSIVSEEKKSSKAETNKRVSPGSITELKRGQDVKAVVPAGTSSELADFNLAAMRRIAAGHGLSYEMVSRDVSQVNYSSARQNLLEDWKVFKQQQEFLISHFLDFVFEGVVKSAILSGKLPDKIVPKDFWKQPSKYLKHEFIGQGLPWIDPYKEAMADKVRLETNQTTLKELYAKQGKDWEEALAQIKKEAEAKAKINELLMKGVEPNVSE